MIQSYMITNLFLTSTKFGIKVQGLHAISYILVKNASINIGDIIKHDNFSIVTDIKDNLITCSMLMNDNKQVYFSFPTNQYDYYKVVPID